MTTPCELVQIEYQGNGTVSVFAFPFPYDFKTEVKVALWNNTTKKHVDILTTDATYPWEVNDANPTAVTFTGTVPPSPPASDVNEDPIFNVRIYRTTDMTDIRSVFNQGSAIRATDLNKNFEQLRYAIQEGKCQIPDKLLEYLDEYYWNNYSDVVYSTETWVSNDQTIATTAALDARFQDEANETIISSETWVADDDKIATTQSLENRFDTLIETDILVDATGLTKSASGGQTTVGIGANSVDLDRIKTADIVQTSAYSSTWTNVDNKVATVGALAARLDAVVSTSQPTTTQTGKFWYNPTEGINALYMWDGSGWKVLTSGTPYIPAGTTIVRYVDAVNGRDDVGVSGFLPQSPLKTIKRAITLINASASGDGTLVVVEPGVYQEALPLTIQKNNISVVGKSLRSCFIHPTVATENSNMWEVDSGTYISGFTMLGLKVPTSDQGSRNNAVDNDATYGLPSNQPFAISFRSGNPVILKSPYVQNCTHFSDAQFDNANFDPNTFPSTDAQTYSAVAGDQTSAPCGGGLLVDGSVPATTSPIRSMVVDAFTQITLDGPGILVTNNGYAQLVSFFGTFCHYHAKAKNGGQINLSNCVTDFGRYGLIAEGKSPTAIASATASAASSGATTVTIGAITSAGSFHGTVSRPLDHMMLTVDGNDYGVVSSTANGSGWNVTITPALSQTISNTAVTFALRSYISTGGHTFEYVGVGTDYSDHPDNGGVAIEANQVKQLSGGKVWQSSTDHIGKFKAGTVLTVDQIAETLAVNGSITVTGTNAVNGNITVTGTVDGRDVATDGTKLDGIETGATADQTAAEIRTLVEAASDSNVFTDADHTKLNGIEASADVTDATNVNAAGAVMNSDASTASMSFVVDEDNMSSNSSTKIPTQQSVKAYVDAEVAGVVDSAPGALDTLNELAAALGDDANFSTTVTNSIATKLPLAGGTVTGNIVMSGSQTVDGRDLSVDGSKLDGIATGATAYANSNVDAHLNQSTASSGELLSWNGSDYDWIAAAAGYSNSSVDSHLNTSTASNGELLSWNGSDYDWTTPAAGYADSNVDTHLNRSTAATGELLSWNGSDYDWVASGGLSNNSSQSNSIGVGTNALDSDTTGDNNTAFGVQALDANTTGANNTAIGFKALDTNIGGSDNVASGYHCLHKNTTGRYNAANGSWAMGENTTGERNVALGYSALYENVSGNYNAAVGYKAVFANTTGANNTGLGYQALYSNTTGTQNVAFGSNALKSNTTGYSNIAIGGFETGFNLTTGGSNILLGTETGKTLTTGGHNVFIGVQSGEDVQTGEFSVGIGNYSLKDATGSQNIAIGYNSASSLTSGANNIVIGYDVNSSSATVSNEITLGNSSITSLRIPGLQSGAANGSVLTYNSSNGNIDLVASAGLSNNATGSLSLGVGTNALDSESASGHRNTAFGTNAGTSVTDGTYNILIGGQAGDAITTGDSNVAVGYDALSGLTTGDSNTAIGYECMIAAGPGATNNVAVGRGSSAQISTGSDNVSIGNSAGAFTTTGIKNTAVGGAALIFNTTGSYNVASGYEALKSNTTGLRNVAVGWHSLKSATTATDNTATGALALYATTTGTHNTAYGSGALKENTTGQTNVGVGSTVLYNNTTGNSNVAVGYTALYWNTTGSANIASGYEALLSNTTGTGNVASGYEALRTNTTGYQNIASGRQALYANTTGNENVSIGSYSLNQNTTGTKNVGVGHMALALNTTGFDNSVLGHGSLKANTTGYRNVAIGTSTLEDSTTAANNTGVGYDCLKNCTGSENTAIGSEAGDALTSGTNNTIIGNGADASSQTVSNEFTLGNGSINTLRCNTQTISSLSDGRDKTEVEDLPLGLDFIDTLRPVKFKWDTRDGNGKDGSFEAGFIAQDLQSAQSTSNADYLKMVMDENPDRLEAAYGQLIPVLVQAIKDLKSEIETLKSNV